MLVVLDANILVSAAITPKGAARRVVRAGIEGRFDYVLCPTLLTEVTDVLARPKIARFLPSNAAERFVGDVRGRARLEPDPASSPPMSRDLRDDYLVALAVAVAADAVVTGDADLLDVAEPPVPILGLRAFAERLGVPTET